MEVRRARSDELGTCADLYVRVLRETFTWLAPERHHRDDFLRSARDEEIYVAIAEGGHGADIGAFQSMVVETLEEIIQSHPGRKVAVFCHGGVINVWTAHVLGMTPRLFFEPGYTSVHRYLCAGSGQRNVVSLNERAHLR